MANKKHPQGPKGVEFLASMDGRLDANIKHGTDLSNKKARIAVLTGKVFVSNARVQAPAQYVKAGTPLRLDMAAPNPARTEPHGLRMVYRDDHVLVVDKPAGLLSAPLPNSEQVSALHGATILCKTGARPKVVHRLDMNTSGLMVFARGVPAARAFRVAMDAHEVRRLYRCVTEGVPAQASGLITSMLMRDAGQGKRGSRHNTFKVRPRNIPDPGPMPGYGKLGITRFDVLAQQDGRAAIEVELSTGRTHQIRIHLSELSCPILGEHVYGRIPGADRHALHSSVLSFAHPITGKRLRFESRWPSDLSKLTPLGPNW